MEAASCDLLTTPLPSRPGEDHGGCRGGKVTPPHLKPSHLGQECKIFISVCCKQLVPASCLSSSPSPARMGLQGPLYSVPHLQASTTSLLLIRSCPHALPFPERQELIGTGWHGPTGCTQVGDSPGPSPLPSSTVH